MRCFIDLRNIVALTLVQQDLGQVHCETVISIQN